MYEWLLPLIVGIIALTMSAALAGKYLAKKRMYHLLWAIGMFLWAVSDFTQLYALLLSWTVIIYLSYFFSSIMLAGFLGAGTLYLVMPNSRVPSLYLWFNVIAAVALIIAIAMVPVNTAALQNAVAGANGISGLSNDIAALVNIPALFTFVGGALYSFIRWRKLYALLIAIGGAVPAVGGSFAAVAIPALLPYTDFIGIIFLSAGFYLSFSAGQQKENGPKGKQK